MSIEKVAVLGCGPAGLLAALAAEQSGREVTIISRKEKSTIPGAQFLHYPIEGLTPDEPDISIDIVKLGDRDGYARKAHGNSRVAHCSWDRIESGLTEAWSMRKAYDILWKRYEREIVSIANLTDDDQELRTPMLFLNLDKLVDAFDLVVSSIPLYALCYDEGHVAEYRLATILERLPSEDSEGYHKYGNAIIYDGRDSVDYHRVSSIDDTLYFEFGPLFDASNLKEEVAHRIIKPIQTNCDCHPNIMRVGRNGRWDSRTLVHSAYWDVKEVLS